MLSIKSKLRNQRALLLVDFYEIAEVIILEMPNYFEAYYQSTYNLKSKWWIKIKC